MQKLDKGEYSGSVAVSGTSNGILASITTYDPARFNDTLHYHDNAHFGFTIGGHCLEKKKDIYQVLPGNITYYHAGEPHQALRIIKPSLRINLEIESGFFDRFRITEEMVRQAAIAVNLRIEDTINDGECWFFAFFWFDKQVLYDRTDE